MRVLKSVSIMAMSVRSVGNIYQAGILAAFVFLTGCSGLGVKDGAPTHPPSLDVSQVSDAVPKIEPRSKYGNPDSYEVFGKTYHVMRSADAYRARGKASWYGTKFHGRRTSSGETYNMYKMTAAHKTLPLPSYVRVTNLDNKREIVVKVNDRGPFHEGRIIDLSYVAAQKLGVFATGTANVEVVALSPGNQQVNSISQKPVSVFVQVGSFAQQENARRLKQRLKASDIESGIQIAGIKGMRRVFRVRVGPFDDRDAAGQVVQSLIDMGLSDAKVISD